MHSGFRLFGAAASALALAMLTGCAASRSGDTYYRGQTMRAQTVELAVVESVRPVKIEGTRTGVGTAGGVVLGGIAGSTVGGGSRANAAGAVAGAILGGVAGHAIEESATERPGVEITVRMDSGRMAAIVQEASELFRSGDRVRVLSDGYTTRITH